MSSAVFDHNEGPRPTHAGGQFLYLAFDGVLHHENVLWHPKKGAQLHHGFQLKLKELVLRPDDRRQLSSTIRVLFIDFDGVMHPEFCHASAHFLHRDAFEGVMRMFPNVDLVISSTWRLQRTLPELKKLFSEDIAERLIGITPLYSQLISIPETLVGYQREAECRAWLQANNRLTQPWVALDDDHEISGPSIPECS